MRKLAIRIETTTPSKSLLPWVAISRKGRQSVDTQFFALIGYPERKLAELAPQERELARDTFEFALRLATAFEYVPKNPEDAEEFFKKKVLAFENKLAGIYAALPPLHIALGVITDGTIHFTTSGEILVLQITPASITNLAETDLDDYLHFDTLQSGTIGQNSCLLIIPKAMNAFLKSDELKSMVLARTTGRKLDYLERVWANRLTLNMPLRAIFLENKPRLEKQGEATAISIANLLDTETKTKDLLSPPLLRPFFRKIFAVAAQSVKVARHRAGTLKRSSAELYLGYSRRPPLAARQTRDSAYIRKSRHTFLNYIANVVERFKNLPSSTRTKHRIRMAKLRENTARALKSGTTYQLTGLISIKPVFARFNALPRKSRITALIIIILAFFFAESILIMRHNRMVADAYAILNNEIAGVQALLDSGDSSLIYNDEANAVKLLTEARNRFDGIPALTSEFKTRFGTKVLRSLIQEHNYNEDITALNAAIEAFARKLRHEFIIETPDTVDSGQAAALGLGKIPFTHASYAGRLYTLEAEQNQILRHERNPDGSDRAVQWLKDASDISSGVSIAIDGFVYILNKNGSAIKFLRGKKQDFELKTADPPLSAMSDIAESLEPQTRCCDRKIWTDEHSDYLYLLDPNQNRLLAFDKKNGFVKAQYLSPAFNTLKDFAVDEKIKTAYLLNESGITAIPLSHL